MSWSLQLKHGDFSLNSTQFGTVTDQSKLVQDLRCALGERMGTDDMHPDFGSLIDGGRMPDGTVVDSPVGIMRPQAAAVRVYSEIERLARAYQNQQLSRAKADKINYNRVTLTPGEVLLGISDIQMLQNQDALTVQVTLHSALGQDITVALPLGN